MPVWCVALPDNDNRLKVGPPAIPGWSTLLLLFSVVTYSQVLGHGTGSQAPVTLDWNNIPGEKKKKKWY